MNFPGIPLFEASRVSGLVLDLDASAPGSLRQLSDGSTAVAAGDPCGYWPSRAGSYIATQATTNNRPTWQAAVRNGRGVLRFDGTNDSYRVASVALDATISVFVVASFNSAGSFNNATGNLFIEHSATSNSNSGFFVAGSSNAPQNVNRTGAPAFRWAQQGTSTWLGTGWSISDFRFQAGAAVDTVLQYWKNGTQQTNGVATQSAGTVASGRSVTADLFIGSRNQASVFSNGDYGRLLIYNRPLTDAEHAYIRRGLARQWAIAVA